ncbi:hypothetical protein PF005_g13141 [Phytophthora fragariae]|uniref:HTH CENPB-type domain-containing protein n=1 Tax=Phytophthora fragariae TaxID=53985 RepID=A0A6A4DA93_9STRA|nr:hypothetical protein PF003_g32568 [Phytophthora fragariae]KAE8935059.1 hypothetical protein PF009_g14978 [Phytophthora fragariae]KAE9105992.1 hypothetical protein PF007_g13566 [Phytophthora fragariae]KAE9141567.1 hypothetical protein PF006_g13139 [Phytophthora fragariae]KAE9206093.1 hypothetical protein PF005_g13141 [Phytophthora fragariae]
MTSTKKTYVRLTLGQKVMICKMAREQPRSRQALREMATRAFDLPRPMSERTLHSILKSHNTLLKVAENNYKRKKFVDPVVEEFDNALLAEFDRMAEQVSTITDYSLVFRAKLFWDEHFSTYPAEKRPGFSKGWVYRFRKRHGIRCIRKQGEAASVKPSSIVDGRARMRELTEKYELRNINNMDETSFFYHADAPRTLSRRATVSGHKADKTRLTMAVTTNADGSDKLPLLFIGRAAKPRAFKNHNVANEFDADYTNSKKAWMNTSLFQSWLLQLDLRMILEQRYVLLLVDNVSSHVTPSVPLRNVKLEFLPKNTTSVLQPLDQGIIACIKSRFTRIKIEDSVNRYIAGLPQEDISILTAIDWAAQAWKAVSQDTISNCWKHSGITTSMSMSRILN